MKNITICSYIAKNGKIIFYNKEKGAIIEKC